jgi:hypothetical protein
VKILLKSAVLRQNPLRGTVSFAVLYFALSFGLDWAFRWTIADNPIPPLWTILVSLGITTAISSVVVYLLLTLLQQQQCALEELNHEMRNAMQVLSYAVQQCDSETAPQAEVAIRRMSDTLRKVSQELGSVSERRLRPERRSRT